MDIFQAIRPETLIAIAVMMFSIVLHEVAHGWTALKAGDDTAYHMGRLTLNPIAHIDPIGTIAMPIIGALSGIPLIGWAKPVPVNPARFRHSNWMLWVSLAGVGANFILVLIAAILAKVLMALAPTVWYSNEGVQILLFFFIFCNLALGIFNLIPIPPLDGSKVFFQLFITHRGSPLFQLYEFLERFGFFILIVLFMTASQYFAMVVFLILGLVAKVFGLDFSIWG